MSTLNLSYTLSGDRKTLSLLDTSTEWIAGKDPTTATQAEISLKPNGYDGYVIITMTLAAGVIVSYIVTDQYGNVGSPVVSGADFPFSAVAFDVTGEMLGFGADSQIPDGVMRVLYTVDGDDGSPWSLANTAIYFGLTGEITCCLDTKFNEIDPTDPDDCEEFCALSKMYVVRDMVQVSLDYVRPVNAQDLIDILTDYCNGEGCNGC